MNILRVLLLWVVINSSASLAKSYEVSPDKHSCWQPPKWCIEHSAKWSTRTDNKIIVTYQNVCQHRIYMRMCNSRIDGSEECGANGIAGGKSTKWYTYNATGDYHYNFTGVLKSSKDWLCANKDANWKKPKKQ